MTLAAAIKPPSFPPCSDRFVDEVECISGNECCVRNYTMGLASLNTSDVRTTIFTNETNTLRVPAKTILRLFRWLHAQQGITVWPEEYCVYFASGDPSGDENAPIGFWCGNCSGLVKVSPKDKTGGLTDFLLQLCFQSLSQRIRNQDHLESSSGPYVEAKLVNRVHYASDKSKNILPVITEKQL